MIDRIECPAGFKCHVQSDGPLRIKESWGSPHAKHPTVVVDGHKIQFISDEEPDPTPSPRRMENRVATLEERLEKLEKKWGQDFIVIRPSDEDDTPDQPAAPRIDPDDEGQIEVVAEAIYNSRTSTYDKVKARYILDALRSHLNDSSNG